jgi:hypothetical protein
VNKLEDAKSEALRYKATVFSQQLFLALKEDWQAQERSPRLIVGLDFDPFLNTQAPSSKYALGDLHFNKQRCFVAVHRMTSGRTSAKPDVVPELELHNGRWVFVNFHYGKSPWPEDENLLSILHMLEQDRQKERTGGEGHRRSAINDRHLGDHESGQATRYQVNDSVQRQAASAQCSRKDRIADPSNPAHDRERETSIRTNDEG